MAVFTEDTQKQILAESQKQNALLKIIANDWSTSSWKGIQAIVQGGMGRKYLPIGTQLNVTSSTYGTLVFDVVAHDHHKKPNDASAHTMTLLQHDTIYGRQIDAAEYMWVNTTGAELAAGTYHFTGYKSTYGGSTTEDGTFQFTITKAIPANGAFRHSAIGSWRSSYAKSYVLNGTFMTYDANGNTIESGLATTEGSEGTNLGTASMYWSNTVNTVGTFNSSNRQGRGSNNWAESGIRQWLNADGAANTWWVKQTIFDTKPSYAGVKGYLADLDTEFVSVLGEVDNVTKRNTAFEADGVMSGSYTTRDKVFLLSRDELGYGSENGIAEGSVLEFYKSATNTDRIKYDVTAKTSARIWWVRSPDPWYPSIVRLVLASGALDGDNANNGYGCSPALIIY